MYPVPLSENAHVRPWDTAAPVACRTIVDPLRVPAAVPDTEIDSLQVAENAPDIIVAD